MKSKKLASEHWAYIEALLTSLMLPSKIKELIGFHYKTAFIHGYKHGVEDTKTLKEENNVHFN